MNSRLWNSPITRRYLDGLIESSERDEYHNKNDTYSVTRILTFTEDERELVERETYNKIVSFWKNLEKQDVVQMFCYIDYMKENNLDFDEKDDVYRFYEPYEEIWVEKEVRVIVKNLEALRKLRIKFKNETDPSLSIISGLTELSNGHAIRLNSKKLFDYNHKHPLRLNFGTQPYSVFASVMKHSLHGDEVVTYQQIADDIPFLLTEKQTNYTLSQQASERNKKISNCVGKISKEMIRVMDLYTQGGQLEDTDLVSIVALPKIGVKLTNPRQR